MFIHANKETIRQAIADMRPLMLERGTVMLGQADSEKGQAVLEIPSVTVADVQDRKWFSDAIAVYDAREPAKIIVDQWRAERTITDATEPTRDSVSGGNGEDE